MIKMIFSGCREGKLQALIYSILYGLTQGLTFYMHALAFRVGGYLIEIGEMTSGDMYRLVHWILSA